MLFSKVHLFHLSRTKELKKTNRQSVKVWNSFRFFWLAANPTIAKCCRVIRNSFYLQRIFGNDTIFHNESPINWQHLLISWSICGNQMAQCCYLATHRLQRFNFMISIWISKISEVVFINSLETDFFNCKNTHVSSEKWKGML